MNNKERFINTILGKQTDRAPLFFKMGFWTETVDRWKNEGIADGQWDEGLNFDEGMLCITDPDASETSVNIGLSPWFDNKIIKEDERKIILRDRFGSLMESMKDSDSLPRHLEYPVSDMNGWNEIKKRLNPHDPKRFPVNFNELASEYNKSEKLIVIGEYPFGLFGTCRELMGVEEFLVSFYTQPELIKDMMDYLTDFWIIIYKKIAKIVKVDCVHIWEDMSGQTGSLISPALVREFMIPNYKKIKQFCDEYDIPIFSVDTDGDVRELIEPFMEAGVNLLYPFEVIEKFSTLDYRKKYPSLGMLGGIDKMEIAKGKEAIDELMVKVREVLAYGRYIPTPDHAIPPQVSHENYVYFVQQLEKAINISSLSRK